MIEQNSVADKTELASLLKGIKGDKKKILKRIKELLESLINRGQVSALDLPFLTRSILCESFENIVQNSVFISLVLPNFEKAFSNIGESASGILKAGEHY